MSSTPHRAPSPVQGAAPHFSSSSSTSSLVDRSSPFTVTAGTPSRLNPSAKAFEIPPKAAADYPVSWGNTVQQTLPVEETAVEAQFEAFIRQAYTKKCLATSQHMVVVFNLEPRTNRKQLANIFFPMGASEAMILDPSELPNPLARACITGRRRVGVVFFDRKDFAMVGVEKIDNFVPNGQHQPLAVRYCGPDAEGSVLSGVGFLPLETPWMLSSGELTKVQADMWSRYVAVVANYTMVAVHGLDPAKATAVLRSTVMTQGAAGCEPWPPQGSPKSSWRCKSMSAVVFFTSPEAAKEAVHRFNGVIPREQSEPLAVVLIEASGPAAVSTFQRSSPNSVETADSIAVFDQVDQYFLQSYPSGTYLVGVHNLAGQTDKATLFKIFYPMGAYDAELFAEPININGKLRRSGVALFQSQGMATEAAAKIHNFVPHGQTRPLVARYLKRNEKERSATPPGHSCEKHNGEIGNSDSQLGTVRKILLSQPINAYDLAEAMTNLVRRSNKDGEEAAALAKLLSSTLCQKKHHAVLMGSPLSTALLELHTNLNIRRRSFNTKDTAETSKTEEEERNEKFVRTIAREMMLLLTEEKAPREARSVAAVLCAYFFQFTYIPGSPFAFSMELIRTYDAKLKQAKRFIAREAGVPTTPQEEEANRPWVTLMDCLEEMTSLWRRQHKSRAKKDEHAKEYDAYVADFYGRGVNTSTGSGTSTPRTESVDVSVESGKRLATVTPSSRPTPRRVVTRTSGSGNHSSATKKNLQANDTSSHAPPQIAISPHSDRTQGISTNTSVESNGPLTKFAKEAPWAPLQEPHADNECTVYITKLPSHLTSGQVRRLLTHYGEFNKVRLCREEKECSGFGSSASTANYNQLCFGFVEFVEGSSAKAMVEYFRNAAHVASPFSFLTSTNDPYSFSKSDVEQLCNTRTSQARNRIHDQQRLDAILRPPHAVDSVAFPNLVSGTLIRVRPCLFGLVLPDVTIETYATACQQLPADEESLLSIVHIPAAVTAATPHTNIFSGDNLFTAFTTQSKVQKKDEEEDDIGDALQMALDAMMHREAVMNEESEDDEADISPALKDLMQQLEF